MTIQNIPYLLTLSKNVSNEILLEICYINLINII